MQNLAIDWMQEIQVTEDKMKGPYRGIGLFEKGDDFRDGTVVNLTSVLILRAGRGKCRWKVTAS